jgi:hypothetical protein
MCDIFILYLLSVVVRECLELYLHSPNMLSWRDAQLKHRDFTFTSRCGYDDFLTPSVHFMFITKSLFLLRTVDIQIFKL